MPLPRKKDTGGTSAPVLNLLSARVRLIKVEEHIEPRTVIRQSDGNSFTFDPAFTCTVEIVDDGDTGADNGAKFFEQFKYKQDKEGGWLNQQNSKLGALTMVVKPGYFDNDDIPELDASDLEDFEMLCRVKPKKNPTSGVVTGSTIDWETMRQVPTEEKVAAAAAADDEDFDNIPL